MRAAAIIASALLLFAPLTALAFPFGGQISQVVPCYNGGIYANVGQPRGGPYVWLPSTKTYEFGPPSFVGQWLLGLASAPFYCLVSVMPIIVWPGIAIDMMGSSGSGGATLANLLSHPYSGNGAVPTSVFNPNNPTSYGYASNQAGSNNTTPASAATPGAGSTAIGHVVISEVFANVDSAHGSSPQDQWVELYNGSASSVDLSGWTLQNSSQQTALPPGSTLPSGQFMLVVVNASVRSYWPSIPNGATVVSLGSPIDGGLSSAGDELTLKDTSGQVVDALSWGTDTAVFSPPVPAAQSGSSEKRIALTQDTNSASDWTAFTTPSPGY